MSGGMGDFAERVGTMAQARTNRDAQPPGNEVAGGGGGNWTQVATAARRWAQSGDGFFPVTQVTKRLPPGAYKPSYSNSGPYLEKMPINTDSLLNLPDCASEMLLAEFRRFWELQANFNARGFTFKRGMLLWGPPGSGKTSAIWQMTQHLVSELNGIVVFVDNPALATDCLAIIRRIEPNRPLITVMEDIDALVLRHGEHGFLALLDGENQIATVCHIATTNYPEYLDKRFVDRPSRFDTIMLIDMPCAAAREAYFKAKEPGIDETTLHRWVKKTDGYSIAHLREVIIATKCFQQSEAEVFDRLSAMRETKMASDGSGGMGGRGGVGFAARRGQIG